MMTLGDVWFDVFSEIMFFIPFQTFAMSIIKKIYSKIGMFTSLKLSCHKIPACFKFILHFWRSFSLIVSEKFLKSYEFKIYLRLHQISYVIAEYSGVLSIACLKQI